MPKRAAEVKFGITDKDYAAMLKHQGGRCAICNKLPPKAKRFCVDHDHRTGEIRGLLCFMCNYVLGFWKDQPLRFSAAGEYLTHPPGVAGEVRHVPDLEKANKRKKRRKRAK